MIPRSTARSPTPTRSTSACGATSSWPTPCITLATPSQAADHCREAAAWARSCRVRSHLAFALHHLCLFYQRRGETPALAAHADELLALAAERGFPFWSALGLIFRGWALAAQGQGSEGLAQLRDGVAAYRATGGRLIPALRSRPPGRGVPGGRPARRVLRPVARHQNACEAHGLHLFEPELHRCAAELLLALQEPDPDEAAARFERAMAAARAQGAELWELRGATCLGAAMAQPGPAR